MAAFAPFAIRCSIAASAGTGDLSAAAFATRLSLSFGLHQSLSHLPCSHLLSSLGLACALSASISGRPADVASRTTDTRGAGRGARLSREELARRLVAAGFPPENANDDAKPDLRTTPYADAGSLVSLSELTACAWQPLRSS